MRMRPHLPIAVLGVSVIAGLAGCGDSGGDAAAAVRPYADANRICLEVAKRFDDLQKDSPRSFQQGEQLLTALSQTAREGAAALEEIEPPALQALAFQRYLKSRDRAENLIDRGVQAAKDEMGDTYENLRVTVSKGAEQRHRFAAQAGLEGCAAAERG